MKVEDVIKELQKHDPKKEVVISQCTKGKKFTALTLKHIKVHNAHKEENEEKKEYILDRAGIWSVLVLASFEEPQRKS